MKAALKIVRALRQAGEQRCAALDNPGLGHGNVIESVRAFRNRGCAAVETGNKAAAELLYFGECVRFATLINHGENGPFVNGERVRLEVPLRVRSSGSGFGKQVLNGGGVAEWGQRDVLAEVGADSGIERCGVAFIKGHNLSDTGWAIRLDGRRQHHTAND